MIRKNFIIFLLLFTQSSFAQQQDYLKPVKEELVKKWPANRTINLVFHGHSVPAGYARTPEVKTFDSYPFLVLDEIKKRYPHAVVNVIVTAIGGENSTQGLQRFQQEVLNHKPDVLFIDYALNDRKIGLLQSKQNMEEMIKLALNEQIKVILLTPSADETVDLLQPGNELELFATQLKQLSEQYKIGLADSYAQFRLVAEEKKNLHQYMAQSNHPNRFGHELIARAIMNYLQ